MGAVRLPKILVLTVDDSVLAQEYGVVQARKGLEMYIMLGQEAGAAGAAGAPSADQTPAADDVSRMGATTRRDQAVTGTYRVACHQGALLREGVARPAQTPFASRSVTASTLNAIAEP